MYAGLERSQEVITQILLSRVVVIPISARLQVVDCEMLACCNDLLVLRVITLKPRNKIANITLRDKSIFAGCLLPSAPSRISETIDIRSPEIESGKPIVGKRSSFFANDLSYFTNQSVVEGSRRQDRCRKACGITEIGWFGGELHTRCGGNTLRCLIPPLVGWQPETGRSGLKRRQH